MQLRKKRIVPPGLLAIILVGSEEELLGGKGRQALTSADSAAHLGLSEAGFRLIVAQGTLQPISKIGKGYLYWASDIEALRKARDAREADAKARVVGQSAPASSSD